MEIKDLLTLLNAGFNKEDIANFMNPNAEQTPEQTPATEPTVEQINAYTQRIVELENENAELRKTNQTLAILRDTSPKPMDSAELNKRATDALASIITPSINDNKGVI